MLFWIAVAVIVCSHLVRFYQRNARRYRAATDSHQKEKLYPCLYWRKHFLSLPIPISRALIFQAGLCGVGITFQAVHVVLMRGETVLVCKRKRDITPAREGCCWGGRPAYKRTHDVGVVGMMNRGHASPVEAAQTELLEELGIKPPITLVRTLFPCDGYRYIIHLFRCTKARDPVVGETDGTFTSFEWLSREEIDKKKFEPGVVQVLDDPFLFLSRAPAPK